MCDIDLKREIQKICSSIADLFEKVDEYVGDEEKSNPIISQLGRSIGTLCIAKMLLFGEDELEDPDKVCINQYNMDMYNFFKYLEDEKAKAQNISDIITNDDEDENE